MSSERQGVFYPESMRRMDQAHQYAHHIIEQRAPSMLPTVVGQLARGIVESAKGDKSLPRNVLRSVARNTGDSPLDVDDRIEDRAPPARIARVGRHVRVPAGQQA